MVLHLFSARLALTENVQFTPFCRQDPAAKTKMTLFWGEFQVLWRVHSSHPFLKPHTWLISVEFTIWLQFCSQCQFPPTNHKSLIYHLLTELGLEGENDRGSLTRHTGGQAIGHGGHLAQRAIAWMSLLSPQDAHYTRLTTKAWLTLGNMITRMKRSDVAWVKHDNDFYYGQPYLQTREKESFDG